jgi:hypothetical protein
VFELELELNDGRGMYQELICSIWKENQPAISKSGSKIREAIDTPSFNVPKANKSAVKGKHVTRELATNAFPYRLEEIGFWL